MVALSKQWQTFKKHYWLAHKKRLFSLITVIVVIAIAYHPKGFVNLWLTPDQQGALLFNMGKYQQAAQTFSDTRWRAFSAYGNEQFDQSAILYSQFDGETEQLARANALAHARQYVNARRLYQQLAEQNPNNQAAQNNLAIVQGIIDEVNRMSESQKPEVGDTARELGDEPQTGDGADKEALEPQETEQYSADQLLLDPSLNEMWLKQVQKNPANFLSQKFHMQQASKAKQTQERSP